MSATPQSIAVEAAQLEAGGGAAFAALPVPIDLVARIDDVNDYDKTKEGGTKGWKWDMVTDGNDALALDGLPFPYWTSFSKASRRKLVQALLAAGLDIAEGVNTVNPNEAIGAYVGVRVDYPRDYYEAKKNGTLETEGPFYKEIRYMFALSEAPEAADDPSVVDMAGEVSDDVLEPVTVL
jgi:hypothetical protein